MLHPTTTALLERIEALEAKDELHSLINRYCSTADAKDWDGYADCFTEDAVYEGPFGQKVGRAAMRDMAAERHFHEPGLQHSITNLEVNVSGDDADGTANLIFFGALSAEDKTLHGDRGGHYRLKFRRTQEGWKIVRNQLDVVWENGTQP